MALPMPSPSVSLVSVRGESKWMESDRHPSSQGCSKSSCKSKKNGQQTSRQKRKEDQRAAAAAVEQTVRKAKNLPNFLYLATRSRRFKGTPSSKKSLNLHQDASQEEKPRMFVVYECPGSVLTNKNPELSTQVFNLTKSNMQQLYDEVKFMEHGWRDESKRRELTHQDSRLLVVLTDEKDEESKREGQSLSSAEDSTPEVKAGVDESDFLKGVSPRRLAGFLHFRFEVEEGQAVVYIYELQVEAQYQRMSIGKRLMLLVELAARNFTRQNSDLVKLSKLMCTCIRKNTEAARFYRNLCGFQTDESDPSNFVNERLENELLEKLQRTGNQKSGNAAAKLLECLQDEEEGKFECEYEILKKDL
ncbi:gnat family protein [Cystoisospora suis]|uniref:N-alpha-acetyltransferase 40 n=1 Tax=Cystoisospora suis TaxID=483139 RepID=A0A2C6KVE0_9APIC|nr:gnat family protein [Cystoisospora suis]